MKTMINVKSDKKLKEQASSTARQMGLPLSTVINAFLKRFIMEKSVTFTAPLQPTKALEKILRQTDKDIKAGKNLYGPFYTSKEFIAELKA